MGGWKFVGLFQVFFPFLKSVVKGGLNQERHVKSGHNLMSVFVNGQDEDGRIYIDRKLDMKF